MSAPQGFTKRKLLLFDLAKAMGETVCCPQCGDPMLPEGHAKRSATRDHILPRTRRYEYPTGTRMHHLVCGHCNNLRAACGHCWGAVACVRAVAKPGPSGSRKPEFHVAASWGLHKIGQYAEPISEATLANVLQPAQRLDRLAPAHSKSRLSLVLGERRPTLADIWPAPK